MATIDLNALVTALTKEVTDLEKQIVSANAQAQAAKARAEEAERKSLARIVAARENQEKELAILKAVAWPFQQRESQFKALEARLAEYKLQVEHEMAQLKATKGQELAQLTQQVAEERTRLGVLQDAIAKQKAAVAAV